MINTLIQKYRFVLITGIILLACISAWQFPRLTINPSFDDYIPEEVGNRAYMKRLDSIFGGNEKIMLILSLKGNILNPETFDRVQALSSDLQEQEGIESCLSLANVIDIRLEDSITEIKPLVEEIPSDSAGLETLKQAILNSRMGQRFVSADLTATGILLSLSGDAEDQRVIPAIREVIAANPGKEEVHIGGLAYLRQSIKSYIKTDLFTLLPAALALMILMLYFSFREWKGVLLPFTVVILSIIYSFGLMAVLGWEISLISILLPVMLIAIANDYSIHLINLYQEKNLTGRHSGMKEMAVNIYRELRKPIVITALTTIGGLLGLLSHKMAPAAQLGVLTAAGIGLALFMSLFLVPVLLSLYPKKNKRPHEKQKNAPTARILSLFAFWTTHHPKRVTAGFLLVAMLSMAGLFSLKIDTNIEGYFIGKSNISRGIEMVNTKFGGTQYVSVLFRGRVLSPEALKRMECYTEEISRLPEVGHVISPSMFFRELSKGFFRQGESGYQSLPETEAEAVQYLEIAGMSGFGDQIAQFIDYNYQHARILVSLKDGSNQTGKSVLKSLNRITGNDPQLVCIAGPGLSKIQIAEMVIHGQISSLLLALSIIFVMLSLIFRSFSAGLKGSLPLLLSTLFLFGLMGFAGIPLDIVTALLSSIMIGVGVDYTIHFLWRYKEEFARNGDCRQSITTTLNTSGRGIIFNAFSVIVGFAALCFSGFAPLRYFGMLVVVSIFSCLISALLLIPAIIMLTRPRFLEGKIKTPEEEKCRPCKK